MELFGALGDAEYLDYAIRHRDVIATYGRFPHRNVMGEPVGGSGSMARL